SGCNGSDDDWAGCGNDDNYGARDDHENMVSAITTIQLFWGNMVVPLLGKLALLTEPPTKELMEKSPVRQIDCLLSNVEKHSQSSLISDCHLGLYLI
ncbi:unnamed protein product, partial [Prunus brigantina]